MIQSAEAGPITKLDSISFDQLLRVQNPFGLPGDEFDLTGIRLITPAGLVQLATACCILSQQGRRSTIIVNDSSVRSYLMRAGFVSAIKSIARFQPAFPSSLPKIYDPMRGSNPLLIEVTKIESGAALPNLLDQIVDVLRLRLGYRKEDAFDVATAVSEICQNTFDHSPKTCGFIAMQVYGQNNQRFVEIGVADHGDGLAATLNKNPKNRLVKSDLQAIHEATKLGTSRYDEMMSRSQLKVASSS